MGLDSGAKNRLRLWLRSERALGLPAVVMGQSSAAETIPAASPITPEPADNRLAPAPPPGAPVVAPATGKVVGRGAADAGAVLFAPDAAADPFTAPPLSSEERHARLIALDQNEVRGCTKCRLCETRNQTVFGEGSPDARLVFIGEGPGAKEDATGRPFVGPAGDLLNKMIVAMGLRREDVYIVNIVKCRAFLPGPPPKDRAPSPDEVATCTPYLQRQLEIIRPDVIVTLGLPASRYMLQSSESMGRLRGRWHAWRGIRLMPTYHPAYVLRNYTDETRGAVWSDLKQVMAELKLPGLGKGSRGPE
jgi:uracil-DNA glycosylase family 4